MELLQVIKALGDENRLRILNILRYGKLCVCEIEHILDITQSNASRHLTKLKESGIIENEKNAKWVYYKINEDTMEKFKFLKSLLLVELCTLKAFKNDLDNLNKYQDSGLNCEDLKIGNFSSVNLKECEEDG